MAAVASYVADTSALARLRYQSVAAALGPLVEAGLVATCGVIEFELGWATRTTAEFDQLRADRDAGYEWLATHDEDWRRALESRPPRGAADRSGQSASRTYWSPPWPNGNASRSCITTPTTTSSRTSPCSQRNGSCPAELSHSLAHTTPGALSASMCGRGGLPYGASLTGRGLVRVSDASGRRHRPPVAA